MKNLIITLLLSFTAFACDQRYEFEREVKPHIVVNSILDPDSVIRMDLWWSKKMGLKTKFNRVVGASVVIEEDGKKILEAITADSRLEWDYHPKEGSVYTLKIHESSQDEDVWAQTTIPHKPIAECTFLGATTLPVSTNRFNRYDIGDVKLDSTTSAMIVTAWNAMDISDLEKYKGAEWENHEFRVLDDIVGADGLLLYTTSQYVDMSNNSGYETNIYARFGYMLIDRLLISKAQPLEFYVDFFNFEHIHPVNWWYYPDLYPHDDFAPVLLYMPYTQYINIVAASEDYDKYLRSRSVYMKHEQIQGTIQDALFSAPSYRVHTNVSKGLGIFASQSSVTVRFKYDEELEKGTIYLNQQRMD